MLEFFTDLLVQMQSYYSELVVLTPKIILSVILFCFFLLIANLLKKGAGKSLAVRMDDPLLAKFVARLLKYAVMIIAFLLIFKILGLEGIAAGLLTGASVSALIVGFAFKDVGENLLAGIMLAFKRPFRIGDTVELDGMKGKVVALNLRDTQLKSFDGKDLFIPNATIVKNPVVNYTIDGFIREDFPVGLDYGSDVKQAIRIILETVNNIPGILTKEKSPSVGITKLSASTLDLTVYYWLDTFERTTSALEIKTKAVDSVLNALTASGYYLPGNIMELKNYAEKELLAKAN